MQAESLIRKDSRYYSYIEHLEGHTVAELKASFGGSGEVYIDRLKVERDYRGNGMGSSLIDLAEEWALEVGATSLFLVFSPDEKRDLLAFRQFLESRGFQLNHIGAVRNLSY